MDHTPQWFEQQERRVYCFLSIWTLVYLALEVAVFLGNGGYGWQWKIPSGLDWFYIALLTFYVGVKEARRAHQKGRRESRRSGERFFYAWWSTLLVMGVVITFAGKPFEFPADMGSACIGVLLVYAASLGIKGAVEIRFKGEGGSGGVQTP